MVDSDHSYHPNEGQKSYSSGNTSSLFAEDSNTSSSSEMERLHKKALETVDSINFTLGGISSCREIRKNACLKLKTDNERLVDMYEGKLLKIDENLQTHRRQKEKWRNEKAGLEMSLSALKNRLIRQGKKVQTNDAEEQQQELRKELIELFKVSKPDQGEIGLKKMGELDCAAFKEAVERNLGENGTEDRVSKLCKTWQSLLMNPQWLPIKTASEDQHKKVVETEDKQLARLKSTVGDEAYEVVVAALEEMCEYSPGGRCPAPAPEVWNFRENRKASLKEGLSYLNDHGRGRKRRRRCSSSSL